VNWHSFNGDSLLWMTVSLVKDCWLINGIMLPVTAYIIEWNGFVQHCARYTPLSIHLHGVVLIKSKGNFTLLCISPQSEMKIYWLLFILIHYCAILVKDCTKTINLSQKLLLVCCNMKTSSLSFIQRLKLWLVCNYE
jgi:hypothetical protein